MFSDTTLDPARVSEDWQSGDGRTRQRAFDITSVVEGMTRSCSRPLGAIFACAAFGIRMASGAPTDAATEPIRIIYSAPPSCPDDAFFFGQIRARTNRVRRDDDVVGARQVMVTVTASPTGVRGHLELRAANSETSVREVSGRQCEQVVSALAFVAAMGIDPQASLLPLGGAPAPDELTRDGASVEQLPPAVPRPDQPSLPPQTGAASTPAPPQREQARATPRPALETRNAVQWSSMIGVDASSLVNLLPAPAWGGRVWFELHQRSATKLLSPSGRVSLGGFATVSHALGPGKAQFQLATARFDGCPVHWPVRSVWQVEPCATLEAGALFGQGAWVASPSANATTHFAAGLLGRSSLAVSSRFRVELEVALVAPIARVRLVFDDRSVYTSPAVTVNVAIGIGMNFL